MKIIKKIESYVYNCSGQYLHENNSFTIDALDINI